MHSALFTYTVYPSNHTVRGPTVGITFKPMPNLTFHELNSLIRELECVLAEMKGI